MKTMKVPENFDAEAFAEDYGLNALDGEFFLRRGRLHCPDRLPDRPALKQRGIAPKRTKVRATLQSLVNRVEALERRSV